MATVGEARPTSGSDPMRFHKHYTESEHVKKYYSVNRY